MKVFISTDCKGRTGGSSRQVVLNESIPLALEAKAGWMKRTWKDGKRRKQSFGFIQDKMTPVRSTSVTPIFSLFHFLVFSVTPIFSLFHFLVFSLPNSPSSFKHFLLQSASPSDGFLEACHITVTFSILFRTEYILYKASPKACQLSLSQGTLRMTEALGKTMSSAVLLKHEYGICLLQYKLK